MRVSTAFAKAFGAIFKVISRDFPTFNSKI